MTPVLLDDRLDELWRELHTRLGASDAPVVTLTVPALDPDGQVALAELLRVARAPAAGRRLRVATLQQALRMDDEQLTDALTARCGPIGNRAASRRAAAAARDDARRRLRAAANDDRLAAWAAEQVRGTGATLTEREGDIAAVLEVLSTARTVPEPLPVVAAEVLGDPHALDHDRPAGRLLASALAALAGQDVAGSRDRRRLLREVGVVADELSSVVAVLRLPLVDGHPLSTAIGDTPVPLTLGQLLRHPLRLARTVDVRIVENPAVLAAAQLRGSTLPMGCTSGFPSVAAVELVTQLREAGCRVLAHADFDAAGLEIVRRLVAAGAEPWAMGTDEYLHAAGRSSVALDGAPAEVGWTDGLVALMLNVGKVGFEEHLLDRLLADATSG